MELPTIQTQFREGLLKLLETLRFSVVLLHNELNKNAPEDKPAEQIEVNPEVVGLMEGNNNFIARIEHLKRNVAYQPELKKKDMLGMVQSFNDLKTEITDSLQTRVSNQRPNPSGFFSQPHNDEITAVLQKRIAQINQNWIKIEGNALQIHLAEVPEKVYADKLSAGTHPRTNRRF